MKTSGQRLDYFLEKHGYSVDSDHYEQLKRVIQGGMDGEYSLQTVYKHIIPAFIKNNIRGDLYRRYLKIKECGCGITKKKMLLIHGPEEGMRVWRHYRRKQAETNTFQYKNAKYGMTKEEFEEYNKSRAVTLDNMILRHGPNVGREKYNDYVKLQAHVGTSLEYFKEKYGEEGGTAYFADLNRRKSLSLENFIHKYGEREGKEKYKLYHNNRVKFVSKQSQNLFDEIYDRLPNSYKRRCYYQNLNKEFGILSESGYKFFDFVITDPKLCIEYNGDYWHANPNIYEEHSKISLTRDNKILAKDIWKRDRDKNQLILDRGYNLNIIWECEWTQSPSETIEDAVKWILSHKPMTLS